MARCCCRQICTPLRSVPLIVNPYGGPHAQMCATNLVEGSVGEQGILFDQLLVQHGFAVLHVNNRGSATAAVTFRKPHIKFWTGATAGSADDDRPGVAEISAAGCETDLGCGAGAGRNLTLYAMTHSDRFVAGVCRWPRSPTGACTILFIQNAIWARQMKTRQTYQEDSVIHSAATYMEIC